VFTLGSKTFFLGALFALACSIGLAFTTSDQSSIVLFVVVAIAMVGLGCSVIVGAGASDRFSYKGGEDARPSREPQSTLTPLICALSAGATVLGFALGGPVLILGGISVAVCLAAWFSEAWRDHPDYFGTVTKRVSNYVSLPFGMPIALLAVIGLVAISVSRTFLAVSHSAAWVVAIVVAVLVFVGAMILAAAPKLSKKVTMAVAAVAAILILAMGAYGLAKGQHKVEEGPEAGTEKMVEKGAVEGAAEPGAEATP
jgi:MFS family permease